MTMSYMFDPYIINYILILKVLGAIKVLRIGVKYENADFPSLRKDLSYTCTQGGLINQVIKFVSPEMIMGKSQVFILSDSINIE